MKFSGHENLKSAVATLRTNVLRSLLTLTGVVVGVWTVMIIASIISGVDLAVRKQIEAFGTRSIFITKFRAEENAAELTREGRMRKELTDDDAAALARLPSVELAVPVIDISNTYFGSKILVSGAGKTSAAVQLLGTLPEYERASAGEVITEGRFFTEFENTSNQEVCVISAGVADSFFETATPLGRALEINGQKFRVVGVVENREQLMNGGAGSPYSVVYLPFNVARRMKPRAQGTFILAVAREGMLEGAKEEVTQLLRTRRQVASGEEDNFGTATADSIIETFRAVTFSIALTMIVVSSIGLLIGGIGVMNIMLVSVTERTKEIGLRKAVGARRRDILWQFLIEAMTLTGTGGLIGLGVGWVTTLLVRIWLPSYVPLWAPAAGFAASVGIGLLFGVWPAWKAAQLDPIEALHFE